MMIYTVIGYDPNNGEIFVDHEEAATPEKAMGKTAVNPIRCGCVLVVAIEGKHYSFQSVPARDAAPTLTFPGDSPVDVETYQCMMEDTEDEQEEV